MKPSVTELAFHPELVAPFCQQFMNANVLALSGDARASLAARFRQALPSYSRDLLATMLRSSWRPAKVAAWVIAVRRDHAMVVTLAECLRKSPAYAEHLCIALAALGSQEAAQALVDYLASMLPPSGNVPGLDEKVSPDWAIAALAESDTHLGTQRAAELLAPDGPWDQFVASRPLLGANASPGLRESWSSRLASAQSLLPQALHFIRTELS